MSVFVFATPHLHLGILAKNVSGDGSADDRRGLVCFSGAGTCVGGTSDNQSGLIITPLLTALKCSTLHLRVA